MNKLELTHIKQSQETACGAAVMAMVYKNLGIKDETEEKIFNRLKTLRPNSPEQYYLRTWDMAQDSKKFGLLYFIGQAVLSSPETALQPIKEFLSASIPVIVCQRVSQESKFGHFRLVIGIDGNSVLLNDPLLDNPSEISIEDFIALWQRTNDDEVIGGQFFAIFQKEQLVENMKFVVKNFDSPIHSFMASGLNYR